jgi:hypothetical protein
MTASQVQGRKDAATNVGLCAELDQKRREQAPDALFFWFSVVEIEINQRSQFSDAKTFQVLND